MRNTLDDIEKAISNTRKAIANLTAQQNQCQNQYTETKIVSQSAHDEALKAAYDGDSSLAIKALSQEVIQEKIATLLHSQIKEQLTIIELLNNNLSILNNIKFALVKCLQNEPSQNNNTQSLAANSRREHTGKDLYSNEFSSEDLLIERVKKVISEKESIEVENISLVHSLL
ncbi:hypothetical protein GNF07_20880, partial [Trichormus variabilis FSR]|uniref:hypothetical protein n=1 Tax=Anabaena variabilis TaxID=264691 RepID=UPI0016238769